MSQCVADTASSKLGRVRTHRAHHFWQSASRAPRDRWPFLTTLRRRVATAPTPSVGRTRPVIPAPVPVYVHLKKRSSLFLLSLKAASRGTSACQRESGYMKSWRNIFGRRWSFYGCVYVTTALLGGRYGQAAAGCCCCCSLLSKHPEPLPAVSAEALVPRCTGRWRWGGQPRTGPS